MATIIRGIVCLALLCAISLSVHAAKIYTPERFGAHADGRTKCTAAIQQAIDSAAAQGGGTVLLAGPGRYVSGTVVLKSGVELKVDAGAELFGSPDAADYRLVRKRAMGTIPNEVPNVFHLLWAKHAANIAISGRGTINGNAYVFWGDTADTPRWIQHGDRKKVGHYGFMIELDSCQDVRITDITLRDSPEWTLHLWDCDRAWIRGIRIVNNLFGPNTDGIDVSGCQDVMISDCQIKTCDDAVCIKTFPNSRDTRNITVTNCVLETLCVGLKLEESFKRSSDINFSNCVVYGSSRAVGIYTFQGGTVERVRVSNIVAETNAPLVLNRPIHIGSWDNTGTGKTGTIRDIVIEGLTATTQGRVLITAAPGHKVENIYLRDINLIYAYVEDPTALAAGVTSAQLRGVSLLAKGAKAALVAENVKNLQVDNLNIRWPETDSVPKPWRLPLKIENGSDRRHRFVYGKAMEAPFSAAWVRNCSGRVTFGPGVTATPGAKLMDGVMKAN